MRKTNLNVKRSIFLKRILKIFVITQFLILMFWGMGIYVSQPVKLNDCIEQQITVDYSKYELIYQEYVCQVFSNGSKYEFPSTSAWTNYTNKELHEEMMPGKVLNIKYTSGRSFFRRYKLIVDARDEEHIYLDFDYYNSQKIKGTTAINFIFLIVEFVFLIYLACMFLFNYKELKFLLKKSPKGKNKI